MQILQSIEDGQLTAREAARLLDALYGRGDAGEVPLRIRVVDLESERLCVDLSLPLAIAEAFAGVGLNLDAPWAPPGIIDAAATVEAARSGATGVLAQNEDVTRGIRLTVSVDDV